MGVGKAMFNVQKYIFGSPKATFKDGCEIQLIHTIIILGA
jgi:hypothetical protein